jgi:hypothetical protein
MIQLIGRQLLRIVDLYWVVTMYMCRAQQNSFAYANLEYIYL